VGRGVKNVAHVKKFTPRNPQPLRGAGYGLRGACAYTLVLRKSNKEFPNRQYFSKVLGPVPGEIYWICEAPFKGKATSCYWHSHKSEEVSESLFSWRPVLSEPKQNEG